MQMRRVTRCSLTYSPAAEGLDNACRRTLSERQSASWFPSQDPPGSEAARDIIEYPLVIRHRQGRWSTIGHCAPAASEGGPTVPNQVSPESTEGQMEPSVVIRTLLTDLPTWPEWSMGVP